MQPHRGPLQNLLNRFLWYSGPLTVWSTPGRPWIFLKWCPGQITPYQTCGHLPLSTGPDTRGLPCTGSTRLETWPCGTQAHKGRSAAQVSPQRVSGSDLVLRLRTLTQDAAARDARFDALRRALVSKVLCNGYNSTCLGTLTSLVTSLWSQLQLSCRVCLMLGMQYFYSKTLLNRPEHQAFHRHLWQCVSSPHPHYKSMFPGNNLASGSTI